MHRDELNRTITEAIRAHDMWHSRLRRAAETGALPIPAQDIACDSSCGFGRWLHGLQSVPGLEPGVEYQQVVAAHAAFHVEAARIAVMIENGACDAAAAALDAPDYVRLSDSLRQASALWSSACQAEAPLPPVTRQAAAVGAGA